MSDPFCTCGHRGNPESPGNPIPARRIEIGRVAKAAANEAVLRLSYDGGVKDTADLRMKVASFFQALIDEAKAKEDGNGA